MALRFMVCIQMQTILCFGDSNTWGYDPSATLAAGYHVRYAHDVRWTGALARHLGPAFTVIAEGQNGRTTVHDDPTAFAPRNGRKALPLILESHKPIDIVVLMLGSNDLKTVYHVPPGDIAAGAGLLVKMILQSDAGPNNKAPKVLLVCPPPVADLSGLPEMNAKMEDGRNKSLALPAYYEAVAKQYGVAFLNSQDIIVPSLVDGIHLEASEHAALGGAVAVALRQMT
ncbi:MAG: hydrolase [Verrucomicrobiaceae bacterium]|nr:hydrolase [Verrucomicrobiaceae bacterium]